MTKLLAALFLTALLSACSLLPEREANDIYRLPSTLSAVSAQSPGAVNWSLRVLQPTSGAQLAGRRIVVIPDDHVLSVYQGAAWADTAPRMIRERLVDAVRADGRIATVSSDERSLHADLELDTDLRAFHSEYRNGRPEAVIRLDARLVRSDTRRIIVSRSFETREAAADTALPAVVSAFGSAADRIALEIADWTVRAGTTEPQR